MGYYSQVVYGIAGPVDEMKAFLVRARLKDSKLTKAIEEMKLIDWGHPKMPELLLYFRGESVKWYDGYEDVKWHNELWNEAESAQRDEDSQFSNLYGSFVRIGEETLDVETHSFGDGETWEIAQSSTNVDSQIDFDAPDIKESMT